MNLRIIAAMVKFWTVFWFFSIELSFIVYQDYMYNNDLIKSFVATNILIVVLLIGIGIGIGMGLAGYWLTKDYTKPSRYWFGYWCIYWGIYWGSWLGLFFWPFLDPRTILSFSLVIGFLIGMVGGGVGGVYQIRNSLDASEEILLNRFFRNLKFWLFFWGIIIEIILLSYIQYRFRTKYIIQVYTTSRDILSGSIDTTFMFALSLLMGILIGTSLGLVIRYPIKWLIDEKIYWTLYWTLYWAIYWGLLLPPLYTVFWNQKIYQTTTILSSVLIGAVGGFVGSFYKAYIYFEEY